MYSPGTEQFALLHPFHLVMDEQMVLRQVGPAIPKLVPGLQVGEPFASCFQVQRPRIQPTYDTVRAMQRAAFLLGCLANGVILKGQMLVDEPRRMILFVGSPVINDRTKLKEYGLTLSDFPMHDSTADLVVFQQQLLINRKLENLVQERTVQLEAEQAKSDSLLHEMLPAGIVQRLKSGEGLIADRFTNVSVLFADLVGFTPLTAELAPAEIVELIQDEFTCEPRGKVMVKGKGELETWYLVGVRPGLATPSASPA